MRRDPDETGPPARRPAAGKARGAAEDGADAGREDRLRRKKRRLEAKKAAGARPGNAGRSNSTALAPVPAPGPPGRPDPEARAARRAAQRAEELERAARAEKALARRRRRRVADFWFRFFGWVLLPTFLVGLYYFDYASDLYVSSSAFVVKAASPPAAEAEGALSALRGTPTATLQESVAVQDFILSREVLGRLDRDLGIVAAFKSDRLDPIRRLPPDATMEDAYDHYLNVVEVGYDPAESVIRMEVTAATPELARAISERLIAYSEKMVDGLSARLREDTLGAAAEAVTVARAALERAHLRVAELQQKLMVYSPEVELGGEAGVIHALELEVEALRGELNDLLSYAAEDDPRVADLRREIEFKRRQIAERRRRLVGDGAGEAGGSLSAVNAELKRAEVEVLTRQQQFMSAMASQEAARIEAQRQIRYLAEVVPPSLADEPTRPRRAVNTALAFLGFFGIFMLVSLTLSVLREQFGV